jgi:hypothetical protein
MKTPRVGVVVAAILMLVAAVGFGIAQAGETNTIGEFMEWQTPGQGSSSSPSVEDRPVLSFEDDMQLRNPTETGGLTAESNTDSSIVEIERDKYREGGDIGP